MIGFIRSLFYPFLWSFHNVSRILSAFSRPLVDLLWSTATPSSAQHQNVGYGHVQNMTAIVPCIPKGVALIDLGASTAIIGRIRPGVVLKSPMESWWGLEQLPAVRQRRVDKLRFCFHVEEQILCHLGDHPRIVRYLGRSDDPQARGLLLGEAAYGDLEEYLDDPRYTIDHQLRLKWCRQAVEAVCYIHEKGVIHSDLRPANFLLDAKLNLRLCDFGGSIFGHLDGGGFPISGFYDPMEPKLSTIATDIFSLGSVLYAIMVGHWPHGLRGRFMHSGARHEYDEKVDDLFGERKWPDTAEIEGGDTILGCWTKRFKTADAVLQSLTVIRYRN